MTALGKSTTVCTKVWSKRSGQEERNQPKPTRPLPLSTRPPLPKKTRYLHAGQIEHLLLPNLSSSSIDGVTVKCGMSSKLMVSSQLCSSKEVMIKGQAFAPSEMNRLVHDLVSANDQKSLSNARVRFLKTSEDRIAGYTDLINGQFRQQSGYTDNSN